jgi:hypothetical protein
MELKVAIVGLDTSHSVEFARRMQAPDCPPEQRVAGLRATRCLSFETPFQDAEGLAARAKQLEQWGVGVASSLEEAVEGADALMLEINDPALHLEYFSRCAGLGLPIFLDKPLADSLVAGRRIVELGRRHGTRWFSASSLRFVAELEEACAALALPERVSAYGPIGKAASGSSVVWYGVHAFEMLQRAMGRGARTVRALAHPGGIVALVGYDGRLGVVELTEGAYVYGGALRSSKEARPFAVDMSRAYTRLLERIAAFFGGGPEPATHEETVEVAALLEATEASLRSGAEARVEV